MPASAAVLVRNAATGALALEAEGWGRRQRVLGASLRYDAGGIAVQVAGAPRPQFLWTEDLPAPLAPLADAATVRLTTARSSRWHRCGGRGERFLGCGDDGIMVASAPLAGHAARYRDDTMRPMPGEQGYWTLLARSIRLETTYTQC